MAAKLIKLIFIELCYVKQYLSSYKNIPFLEMYFLALIPLLIDPGHLIQ